jgi:hypothetical protein
MGCRSRAPAPPRLAVPARPPVGQDHDPPVVGGARIDCVDSSAGCRPPSTQGSAGVRCLYDGCRRQEVLEP